MDEQCAKVTVHWPFQESFDFARRAAFHREKRRGISWWIGFSENILRLPLIFVSFTIFSVLMLSFLLCFLTLRCFRKPQNREFTFKHYVELAALITDRLPFSAVVGAYDDWKYRMMSTSPDLFDSRKRVLYLRPFSTDDQRVVTPSDFDLSIPSVLLTNLAGWGPLVALDRNEPKEKTKYIRVKTENENWKDTVSQLIDECGHIVLIVDATQGTSWEILQIIEKNALDKTVFMNLHTAGKEHPAFGERWRQFSETAESSFISVAKLLIGCDNCEIANVKDAMCMIKVLGKLHVFCHPNADAGLWSGSAKSAMYYANILQNGNPVEQGIGGNA